MKKDKKINNKKLKASIFLQLTLFFIFIVGIFILLYRPLTKFKSNDSYPSITEFTPHKIIEFGGSPTPVEVGLYIKDIPNFDIINAKFIFDLTVWFKFDNKLLSLDRISKFKFDRATILEKSKPTVKIEDNGIVARYDLKASLNTTLNYKDFPLDDHKISLSLTNYDFTPSEITFKSSILDLVINPNIKTEGWKRVREEVKTGFLEDKTYYLGKKPNTVHHPRIIFSLHFAKIGVRQLITILIPLLMILFISIITLTFDPFGSKSSKITTISVTTITAVIAHRFIIDNLSPKTGYFMISDYMFFIFLLGCIAIFVINLFTKKISGSQKNIITTILYILNLAIFIYMLYPLL